MKRSSLLLLTGLLALGCGGTRGGGGDDGGDASDVADVPGEPPADTANDPPVDPRADGDAATDVPGDPPVDTPVDPPVDTPVDPPAEPDAPLACTPVAGTPPLRLELVTSGLSSPVQVVSPPGDPRLFIVEKVGRIRIFDAGALRATAYLDISARVSGGSEQGLLGLAFHPSYATNGRFFVNYTDTAGDTHVAEGSVMAGDPNRANTTLTDVLFVSQPFSNHNGGNVVFGPDGYLYIGLGDGGSGGDPAGNGQNINTLLGDMLRIDINGAAPYVSPPSNPFVGVAGRDEIWAWGLRNPWRYSFDRLTGDLYIADVGQNRWEEVDVQPATSRGGENYGWNRMEGNVCYTAGCSMAGLVLPVYVYPHPEGCSITGGFVYRGCRMPGHHGKYFFGDFCSGGWVRSFRWDGAGGVTTIENWPTLATSNLSSFGEDAQGELYTVSLSGSVYRIVP